jgi:hypothetical protein
MSAFKLHTLKQKLWAIAGISLTLRLLVFDNLPNQTTPLSPDEGAYAQLTKWIGDSNTADSFPIYGEGLYSSARALILPASVLYRIGINEFDAVRLVSAAYAMLSLVVCIFLALNLQKRKIELRHKRINEKLVVTLFLVYAFLPSHFLWAAVGLRESTNEFWLIMAFIGVFLLYKEEQSKKALLAALISLSIICTFSSRPQVGWVLVVTLLLYASLELNNKLTYLLITSVLVGLFAGYFATTSSAYVTSDVYVAKDAAPAPSKDAAPAPSNRDEINASKLCSDTKTKVEYEGKTYNCIKSGTKTTRERISNLAEVAIDQVEALPGKQIANQVGAASIIQRLGCPLNESSEIGKYGCLAYRAPYMTLTFLFRPLPFIDTTSLSSLFAAAENTLWILMFALVAYRIYKLKRIPFIRQIGPAVIFLSLYSVGAGSYEGNMGTAFRHKSLILWIVLILLLVLFWRHDAETEESKRNNSQESAV